MHPKKSKKESPATESASQSWGRWTAGAGFLLTALIFFTYRGLWNNAFFQDDYLWLDVAREITWSPLALFRIDPDNSEAAIRMTQRIVMGVVQATFGLSAAAHHIASLVLHAVASTLVFRLLLELHTRFGSAPRLAAVGLAGFGAIVFAASHNHGMAVLWLSAQSGVLAAIAVLILSIFLLRNLERMGDTRVRWGAALLFLLALYSKNTAVGFPAVVAALYLLDPLGTFSAGEKRAGRAVAGILLGLGVAHILFTKLLLVRLSDGSLGGNFALSSSTPENVLGAFLAPFLSSGDFEARLGESIPYVLVALVMVAVSLGLARLWGVFRPVVWGFVWIGALVLPISFLDFEVYDVTQFTLNRYFYGAGIGASIVMSFLARGLGAKLRWPKWGLVVLLILAGLHVAHHERWTQRRIDQFAEMGATDQRLVQSTLVQARQRVEPGSTIYALNWPMEEEFVPRLGRVYLEPAGYRLEGKTALENSRSAVDPDPWVASLDAQNNRFGVMRYSTYLRLTPGARP